jgi:DNA-binding GntR family transcriptional regulator
MDDELTIDRRDLTDQAYELLKAQILARKFRPNEKLSVDRLAKRLGVSRTPTKDALNRLAADGLISIEPRVGSFVTPMTTKDIQEIFSLRLLLELYAAEEGFDNITPAEITELREIVVEMADCIEGSHYRAPDHFMALDHRLHLLVVDSPGNDRLTAIYESLNVHIHVARAYYVQELANAEQGQQEHEGIVNAYVERDLLALKDVLSTHIITVRNLVLQNLEAAGGIL